MTGRIMGVDFQLRRNAMGKLVLTSNGQTHEGVMPVRAFPISAPAGGCRW